MKKINDYIVIGLLVISGIFAWQLFFKDYNQQDTVDVRLFPEVVAGWTSEDIPLTEDEYAILETRNLFVRQYTSPDKSKKVMLYIIYSQTNRKASHPPEMCFAGSGLSLVEHQQIHQDLPGVPSGLTYNRMHWEKDKRNQLVYHWYKAGNAYEASYWKHQALVAWNTLFTKNPSLAMVRLSTPYLQKDDLTEADQTLQEFMQLMLPLLTQYAP